MYLYWKNILLIAIQVHNRLSVIQNMHLTQTKN